MPNISLFKSSCSHLGGHFLKLKLHSTQSSAIFLCSEGSRLLACLPFHFHHKCMYVYKIYLNALIKSISYISVDVCIFLIS